MIGHHRIELMTFVSEDDKCAFIRVCCMVRYVFLKPAECTVKGFTARLFCAAWWKTFLLWQCYPKKKHRYFLFLIFSRATDKKTMTSNRNEDECDDSGWWAGHLSSSSLLSDSGVGAWKVKKSSSAFPSWSPYPLCVFHFLSSFLFVTVILCFTIPSWKLSSQNC